MDHEKTEQLMLLCDDQEKIKLRVLHNAAITGLKNYNSDPTATKANNWRRAEKELAEVISILTAKYIETERKFPNALAVSEYLNTLGYKASKSLLYKHQKEGRLRPALDGQYKLSDIEKYAATLKRKDGSQSVNMEKLQQQKLVAETDKAKAQARHWTLKSDIASGNWIHRDDYERDLATRSAIFRNDLENFFRSQSSEIIARFGGDSAKTPELIEYLLEHGEIWMNRYAEDKEFTAPERALEESDADSIEAEDAVD